VSDPTTAHLIRSSANVAPWLLALAGRLEARVDGACVGAGVELAAFCDHVIASPRARFRLPELSMGLIPGAGGTVSIPRRIGRQRTLNWLVTNRELSAEDALDWGLVDELTDG
jgi:enoyl-CoA hydratase/carnithine racemase